MADFRDRQVDEILPGRGPVDEPQPAGRVSYPLVVQMPAAHVPQEVVNLVDGQDRGGRVVDGRR